MTVDELEKPYTDLLQLLKNKITVKQKDAFARQLLRREKMITYNVKFVEIL